MKLKARCSELDLEDYLPSGASIQQEPHAEAAGAIIDDSFTRCFKSNPLEPWNWNVNLFPLWCFGVVIRHFVLFPPRYRLYLDVLRMLACHCLMTECECIASLPDFLIKRLRRGEHQSRLNRSFLLSILGLWVFFVFLAKAQKLILHTYSVSAEQSNFLDDVLRTLGFCFLGFLNSHSICNKPFNLIVALLPLISILSLDR